MNEQHPPLSTDSEPAGTIRLSKGKHELIASQQAVTIDGQEFRLDAVDRVIYRAAGRINQASYLIGLADGDRKRTFMFDAYRKGTDMEDARAAWSRLVDLLESTACPRIGDDALRAVASGATVTFGGPASSRVDAGPEGLRPRRLFATTIPWERIARADLGAGLARVWTIGSDGRPEGKPAVSIDMSGWNSVILPRVVAHLTKR